jgi:hypothetical protein
MIRPLGCLGHGICPRYFMSNGHVRRASRLNEEGLPPKCLAAEGALGGYPIEILADDSAAGLSGPWELSSLFHVLRPCTARCATKRRETAAIMFSRRRRVGRLSD